VCRNPSLITREERRQKLKKNLCSVNSLLNIILSTIFFANNLYSCIYHSTTYKVKFNVSHCNLCIPVSKNKLRTAEDQQTLMLVF
jgi:hypothetical protein